MHRHEVIGLSVAISITAAIVVGTVYAERHMSTDVRMTVFLLMTIYSLVSSVWALVSWIRAWRNMGPEERLAYRESRRHIWRWKS